MIYRTSYASFTLKNDGTLPYPMLPIFYLINAGNWKNMISYIKQVVSIICRKITSVNSIVTLLQMQTIETIANINLTKTYRVLKVFRVIG